MLKYELLEEAFYITTNDNSEEIETIQNKLSDYLKSNGSDPQIEDAIRALDTFLIEAKNSDFEKCCEIAKPIFVRLSNPDDWDFYDIRILNRVVDYAGTYKQVYELAENLLTKLEKYSHEERYKTIKVWILLNTMLRMLRAKYFEMDDLIVSEELDKIFSHCFDIFMKISNEPEFNFHREVARIRRGLFYRDDEMTNEGFVRLRAMGNKAFYKILENYSEEYHGFLTEAQKRKKQLALTIGRNIHKKRKEMGLTARDLARVIDITPPYMGQIEAGDRTPSPINLSKLCDFFGVTPNYFYGIYDKEDDKADSDDPKSKQMTLLNGYAQNFSLEQLEFLVRIAKDMSSSGK